MESGKGPDQPQNKQIPTGEAVKRGLHTKITRRGVLKTAGVAGTAVAVERMTRGGGLKAVGKWWEESGKRYEAKKAQEAATATAEASKPTPTPEPTPTMAPEQKEMQEMQAIVDTTWNLYTDLLGKSNMSDEDALHLLPPVLEAKETQPVLNTHQELQSHGASSTAAAILTPAVFETQTPIDQASAVFKEATAATDNGLFRYPLEGAAYASIALRHGVSGREVAERTEEFGDFLGSNDAAKAFMPLLYVKENGEPKFTEDKLQQSWTAMRQTTRGKYEKGVDEMLTIGHVVSGEPTEAVMRLMHEFSEVSRKDRSKANLTLATIANGHNKEQVVTLFNGFLNKMRDNKQQMDSELASSLTMMTVLKDPALSGLSDMDNMSADMNTMYQVFINNPLAPWSPNSWIIYD